PQSRTTATPRPVTKASHHGQSPRPVTTAGIYFLRVCQTVQTVRRSVIASLMPVDRRRCPGDAAGASGQPKGRRRQSGIDNVESARAGSTALFDENDAERKGNS